MQEHVRLSAGGRARGRKTVGGNCETRALFAFQPPLSCDCGQVACQNVPKVIYVFYMHSCHYGRESKWKYVVG